MNNDQRQNRQTKVICTIGPACRSPSMLEELIRAGMDVARLHFSYGAHSEHAETIRHIRELSKRLGRYVAILQDLSGSKARMIGIVEERVRLEAGARFTLKADKVEGDSAAVSISVPELVSVVTAGDTVLLADGELELRATAVTDSEIRCEVIRGGSVKSQQGVHVPGKSAPVRVPTEKDREDVRFGIQHGVDWIAMSYGTTGGEVHELREFIRRNGADTPVVAKIERAQALKDLESIIHAADAVMVARGDLGMEISLEEIAWLQKDIIHRANVAGKPVITATEMLTSMMEQPRPTRAEVTDITNAILDGSDAVMLSGESAIGKYPLEAVTTMRDVALAADHRIEPARTGYRSAADSEDEQGMAVAQGACQAALAFRASLILCCTRAGRMARLISQERPGIPVAGVSSSESTLRRMALFRGVEPVQMPATNDSAKATVNAAKQAVVESGLAQRGERVIVVTQEETDSASHSIRAEVL